MTEILFVICGTQAWLVLPEYTLSCMSRYIVSLIELVSISHFMVTYGFTFWRPKVHFT
ncbi:hypothetical protein [Shewanella sp. Pdp11]|uniref:hypothetical protein n=1 Tax=Shewanella sp. Pdp11 TaxID=2059264 RepID=UPI0012FF0B0C|nr:hypothetical protein [Shewanella sp. Pdp11]